MTWDEAVALRSRLVGQEMNDTGITTTIVDVSLADGRFTLHGHAFDCMTSTRYGSVGVDGDVLRLSGRYGIPNARVHLKPAE